MIRPRELAAVALIVAVVAACDNGVLEQDGGVSEASLIGEAAPPEGPVTPVDTDENYDCTSRVTGTFDNVFVPQGAACSLEDAVVNGNVLARERSQLFVSGSRIAGNIDGVEAHVVQVRGGSLEGSIQIQDGSSPEAIGALVVGTRLSQGNITIQKMRTGGIEIRDVILVKGNIQIQESPAGTIAITGGELGEGNIQVQDNAVSSALDILQNLVAQNLEVFVNDGSGDKAVTGNTVGQTLVCKENTPLFTGGPNTAGEAEEQCF